MKLIEIFREKDWTIEILEKSDREKKKKTETKNIVIEEKITKMVNRREPVDGVTSIITSKFLCRFMIFWI